MVGKEAGGLWDEGGGALNRKMLEGREGIDGGADEGSGGLTLCEFYDGDLRCCVCSKVGWWMRMWRVE